MQQTVTANHLHLYCKKTFYRSRLSKDNGDKRKNLRSLFNGVGGKQHDLSYVLAYVNARFKVKISKADDDL